MPLQTAGKPGAEQEVHAAAPAQTGDAQHAVLPMKSDPGQSRTVHGQH
jgi:hypothetical protein